mmetsp:Transcript_343/g.695  ORF Transcript_343/g.695 Transcript_343/m.695 type:complete len:212 (-) Transcript_343:200-835(-)
MRALVVVKGGLEALLVEHSLVPGLLLHEAGGDAVHQGNGLGAGLGVEESRVEGEDVEGVGPARPAHLGVVKHIVPAICGLGVEPITECLDVLIAVQVVKRVLEGQDVNITQQHAVTQNQELLDQLELHGTDAVVGCRLVGSLFGLLAPVGHTQLLHGLGNLVINGDDHEVLHAGPLASIDPHFQHSILSIWCNQGRVGNSGQDLLIDSNLV